MKLWHKLSLVCGSILTVVILLCTAVQLHITSENLLNLTTQRVIEKQQVLADSFREMVNYYSSTEDSPIVRNSLANYCFNIFADDSGVLILDGETLHSDTTISPAEFLPLKNIDSQKQYSGIIDERNYFIVGSGVDLMLAGMPLCFIYVVEDISAVYTQIQQMIVQFLCIGLAAVLLGLLFVVLLVRRSLAPLENLRKTASNIADGNYSQRATVNSQDEIGVLAQNFNAMAEAVETHIEKLTDTAEKQRLFVGAVTHEFKTPLTGILLNADNLKNTYMSEEKQLEALSSIQDQGKWLERLVQKMLKLITVNQDISLKPFSISQLLERVRESSQGILEQRDVILDIQQDDFIIVGDIDLLQSALLNLVDNGSKASLAGGHIVIEASNNIIEVRDFGYGIPREILSHITEPFYIADRSRSKKQGGVGLGLALVQEIVEAHGARLEIESDLGHGTSIRIHFQS